MANSYTQATLTPLVHLTKDQRMILAATGASLENQGGGLVYVFWEETVDEDTDIWIEKIENMLTEVDDLSEEDYDKLIESWREKIDGESLEYVFRAILNNPENKDVAGLFFEGVNTCSTLRQGEFGGFSLAVTRDEFCWVNTKILSVEDGKIKVNTPTVATFYKENTDE